MPRKRLFAVLILLLILPCLPCRALGEHARVTATFSAGDGTPAVISDLLNALSVEGEYHAQGDQFDLTAGVILSGDAAASADFRLCGTERLVLLDTPLLGDKPIAFYMASAMEFAIKAYRHLGLPLQDVAVWIPYAVKDAFARVGEAWNAVFHQSEGPRTISRGEIVGLANTLAEMTYNDRALRYYLMGLDTMSGLSDAADELLAALPDYLTKALPEEGVVVAVTDEGETYSIGGEIIAKRNGQSFTVRLDHLAAYSLVIDRKADEGGTRLDIVCGGATGDILRLQYEADAAPASITTPGAFGARLMLSGSAMNENMDLAFRCQVAEGGAFTASLQNGGRTLVSAEGTVAPAGEKALAYDDDALLKAGFNFFSLSDDSILEFARAIREPFIRGALPFLLRAPVSFTSALLNEIISSGAIDMLAPKGGRLPALLKFLVTPFGAVCMTAARAVLLYPLPFAAGGVALIAAIVVIVKRGRARKRARTAGEGGTP